MSKAKLQASQNGGSSSSAGFATGFLLGQLTLALILFFFIKFFIFGEAPNADTRAAQRATSRRQRTLSSNTRQRALSSALRPRPSSAVLKPRTDIGLSVQKILEKTYYNVQGHQPESLDWFNVLVAQTIAQLRADAAEDEAVPSSLTSVLNSGSKPDFLDEIKVTEISLGEEFPIFSNCRVIPVDENGTPIKALRGDRGERLQARMDVDLGDVLTLGIETKLVLNYPKPFVAVLPVALAVSVVRFSGTLSLSFSPSSQTDAFPTSDSAPADGEKNEGHPLNPTGRSPTTLTFTFLDDYRLDLSVHSLIGSRSRLQDVPKIAQLVEDRIHAWFDQRCVEPRFQQIVLPSLWPRKRNTRGGESQAEGSADATSTANEQAVVDGPAVEVRSKKEGTTAETAAEQRTRDWAARQSSPRQASSAAMPTPRKGKEELSDLELAGEEMREADERKRRKGLQRQRTGLDDGDGVRLRSGAAVRAAG
ncbi:Maintenance of mitochondrial morphology protein 1 [Cryoendolithus antarcticus]|uniref:Maintenance of mitochondrial morphology protein 1 n=1 Tax=Cryoendolithus antarcticus TaxID=1507870 RepID=A0A1V8SWT1_9PEZI|nr:Maintenance of mitochondrial morphology protein 1 [Cryoendolithus antarcticus]